MSPSNIDNNGAPDGIELRPNFLASITALGVAVRSALAPLAPVFESIGKVVAAAEPDIRKFAVGLAQIQKSLEYWEKNAPAIVKDAIGSQGLIVPAHQMSFPEFVNLIEIHQREGKDAVVQRVRQLYDEIFGAVDFLDRLESEWVEKPSMKRRLPLLREALKAHKLGMYGVSVPTFLAQFEGLVADMMNHKGMLHGKDLKGYVGRLVAKESETETYDVTGVILSSFVVNAFLASFGHSMVPPPFSRHAILHGGDVLYGNGPTSSRTAILLIDHLSSLS